MAIDSVMGTAGAMIRSITVGPDWQGVGPVPGRQSKLIDPEAPRIYRPLSTPGNAYVSLLDSDELY